MVKRQRGRLPSILAQCTFPDYGHSPTSTHEILPGPTVPRHVRPEFRLPEARPSGGVGSIGTSFMTVPETAMHETDSAKPTEHQVRRPRELPVVKTVPEAAPMQRAAKDQLGFRVLPADSRHHSRPNRSINYIGHDLLCIAWEGRDRACISQNIVKAIKEDGVTARSMTRSDFGHRETPDNLPEGCLMGQPQHLAPILRFATHCSGLPGDPPGKRLATCRPATRRP